MSGNQKEEKKKKLSKAEELEKIKNEAIIEAQKELNAVLDKYGMDLMVDMKSPIGNPRILLKFK